ncbi:hypothetical protein [Agrococcus sp. ProA11]|uniref:hypothetical protein n=1 Tax=Agrococcus chionoecetis TaxID=3153752 RepID=UPI0032616E53
MSDRDDHQHDQQDGDEGTKKADGLGSDGTIPNEPDGLAATTDDEPSTFEPEEGEPTGHA